MRPRARYLVGVVLIAAAHFGAAKLSLEFAFVGNVSAIWLPAGVGIGALVAFGLRYWPAILLGETFAISTSGVPLGVALAEIAGNTLAALLGAGIVIGALRGRRTLTRLRDVVALVAFAAPTSALVSASIGVSSLVAGGVIPSTSFLHVWQRWLLADVTGVIVVAPALIVLADQRLRWLRRERALEAFALVAALAAVAPLAFVWAHGRPYFALPVLLWAAVRFLQPGAVAASALTAGAAIALTAHDVGFFARGDVDRSLVYAQLFMSIGTLMSLVLGVVNAQRETVQRRLEGAARQQAAVASLGQRALAGLEPPGLLHDAVQLVASTLDVELAEILELLPDGDSLLVRAGVGWKDTNVLSGAVRRTEQARILRESEERLRLALGVGGMGVWDWDIVEAKIRWSEALEEMRGYDAGGEAHDLDWFFSLVHPDDLADFRRRLDASIERGEDYDHEIRIRRANGTYHWSAARGRVLRDGAGRPVRMLGVASDVTARREAEEELRRSRELYRLVVETSEDLITLIDPEGELVYVSPSHERSLGFAPDELRKLGLDQLVHPDELPAVRALLESAAAREERPALEARIRSRSGAWVRIEGVATPILDEDGSPVMSSPRRVT